MFLSGLLDEGIRIQLNINSTSVTPTPMVTRNRTVRQFDQPMNLVKDIHQIPRLLILAVLASRDPREILESLGEMEPLVSAEEKVLRVSQEKMETLLAPGENLVLMAFVNIAKQAKSAPQALEALKDYEEKLEPLESQENLEKLELRVQLDSKGPVENRDYRAGKELRVIQVEF